MYKLLVVAMGWGLGWFALAGCSAANVEGVDDPPADEQPARLHPRLESVEHVVPIAFPTRDGSLVLTDPDGNELARSPNAGLGGEIDATFDPQTRTITTFEASADDEESGQLWRYELDGDFTGFSAEGAKLAKASGTGRLASVRLGLVQFEESAGARWKAILHSGKNVKSLPCPRPGSIAIIEGVDRAKIVALATNPDGGAWARFDAELTPDGWGPCSELPLPDLGLANPRLVVLPDGEEIALGVEDGMLAFGRIGSDDETTSTGVALESLAAATHASIPRPGGEDASVLVALGGRPTRLVVAWRWSEDGVSAIRSAFVDLPGEPRVDDQSMARDVAVVGDRVLCATTAGVFAVDVSFAEGNVVLAERSFGPEGFAASLTGPITVLEDPT